MRITATHEAHATALITHDVQVTLGTGQKGAIRREASMRRQFYNSPDAIRVTPEEYAFNLAEEIQQYFHDCHIDSTWPACPFHQRHPLWLHDGNWVCEQSQQRVARLGELRAHRDPAGGYRVVAE